MITPILMLGAGRMGGAVLEGWRRAQAFAPSDLLIRDPALGRALAQSIADKPAVRVSRDDVKKARRALSKELEG